MNHAEDRRVRADADGERCNRDEREHGGPTKRACRVAEVLPRDVEPARDAHPARLFLEIGGVAKLAARREASVVERGTVARPLFFGKALMNRVFFGALAVGLIAVESAPESVTKGVDE